MIREASRQEIDDLLSSRGIEHSGDIGCQCYVVEQGVYRMLLCCQKIDDKSCEVHVCYPKEFMVKSRDMCIESINWLFSQGFERVYTALPEHNLRTTHNLCKRIGFAQIGCYNGHIIYERCKPCQQV